MAKHKQTRHTSPPAEIGALAQEQRFRRRVEIYQQVAGLIVRGDTITAACEAAGVNCNVLLRWRNLVSVGGLAALDFPLGSPRHRAAKRRPATATATPAPTPPGCPRSASKSPGVSRALAHCDAPQAALMAL